MVNKSVGGFTIIELLIVVAIIAVLAGIVFVNINNYIQKGRRAAVKGDLSVGLTYGAEYFFVNGSYSGICDDPKIIELGQEITEKGGVFFCYATATNDGYCLCSELPNWYSDAHVFCGDNTGYKKETPNNCGNACSGGFCRE